MADFDYLFTPIKVGTMTVPNRICETTYSINAGRADGLPDAAFIEHHLQKARGGVGWIGSQTWLLPTPLPPGHAGEVLAGQGAISFAVYQSPKFVERVRQFTDAVRACGAVSVMQLTHLQSLMGPSPVPISLLYDHVPSALEPEHIEFILDTYWKAAEKFHEAGADAVEIHCAHETLPQWFLSPYTNKRGDQWGGSPENRVRFVVEAVRRIRERVARELNVGLRINADEYKEGGYTLEDMKAMAQLICSQVSLDFLNVDVGSPWGMPSYIPPMQYPLAAFAYAAAEIRQVVNLPVLYAGRVNDPVLAERLLAEGQADLIGMTRASLADPDFPRKARSGQLDDIRKCIGCNTCIGKVIHDEVKSPVCAVNPVIGHEREWAAVAPAKTPKRVIVIGAGAGGLEAARVAAMRGHKVIVLERNAEIGGQLLIAAKAPRREGFLDFPRYQEFQLRRLNVKLRLNTVATAEMVLGLQPEVVIAATGSLPRTLEVAGSGQDNVVQSWDVLRGTREVGGRVVIVSEDDGMETPSVADFLAAQGKQVEILHKWLMIGSRIERYTQGIVFYWLYKNGVVISPSTRVRAIEGSTVIAYNSHTSAERRIEGVDHVVLSLGSQGDNGLYRALKGRVPELYLVGSAFAPRRLVEATQHGARIGKMI
ncbi:MAG: FAD-dependent oxidoreductase [Deltaproteobacteria bacterium]|nr:FAD-dependent oxidoreductase [Deltaproteobacteria bacterium]